MSYSKDFTEKPERKVSNDHYWNSGIFVFRAKRYIDEIKKLLRLSIIYVVKV